MEKTALAEFDPEAQAYFTGMVKACNDRGVDPSTILGFDTEELTELTKRAYEGDESFAGSTYRGARRGMGAGALFGGTVGATYGGLLGSLRGGMLGAEKSVKGEKLKNLIKVFLGVLGGGATGAAAGGVMGAIPGAAVGAPVGAIARTATRE